MLFVTNDDKPGFIGALGTNLGQSGVNIATFHLGRARKDEDGALALVCIDQRPPQGVIEQIRALPDVRQAKALSFDGTV
jgi:D-3-phosphoglycerate dehydrogenase